MRSFRAGRLPISEQNENNCKDADAARHHLSDLRREHGERGGWPGLTIPNGRQVHFKVPAMTGSSCGSAAALCAEQGDLPPRS